MVLCGQIQESHAKHRVSSHWQKPNGSSSTAIMAQLQTPRNIQGRLKSNLGLSLLSPLSFHKMTKVLVAQWYPTLCDHMDCSPPGSSIHGILQARILEWVAFPHSKGSSGPRDQTQVSRTTGICFTI